jgi:hypothetical protein
MRSRTTFGVRAPCTNAMSEPDTKAFDVPPTEPAPAPVSYDRVERRIFGLAPRALVGSVALILFSVAAGMIATGQLVAGVLLLVVSLVLAGLYVEQARANRGTAADRMIASVVDNSSALAGLASGSVRAWTSAGRRAAELRLEARRLLRQRSELVSELGEAAYEGGSEATEQLRGQLHALDARREACDAELRDVIEEARSRTRAERLAVGPTEIRHPDAAQNEPMGDPGFEPGTSALSERRSNQLS